VKELIQRVESRTLALRREEAPVVAPAAAVTAAAPPAEGATAPGGESR
jgi:hypothetical protein